MAIFMKLYLVQHAEPKSKEEDPTRPLSDRGRKNIRKIAKYVGEHLQLEVEQIIHSGKLRAKQTAEVLAEHLTPSEDVMTDESLEPLADPQIWKNRLAQITKHVMLVGHLPHLSKLASSLLVNDETREIVAFSKGGIVCLERDRQRQWTIQWMITPETAP